MGLFSFIKEAGEKLLGINKAQAQPSPAAAQTADLEAAAAIVSYINKMELQVSNLSVVVNTAQGTVKVSGEAADQITREKVVLCCGNTQGIGNVEDAMTVKQAAPEAQWHTVVRGDTLWAIAEKFYGKGKGKEYNRIFEANRPMLSHPDKIYPGQMLRIPPLG
ncbi:MAG: peptidoglycan-binding protein LysM [Zoogloeaceae bacterium]|jgi:nucleoid-associated protein YgaU|nr:peptidoglycan-binding protein LysM [Zoogloeaceae bacterium]